ncbi:hypothetical protein LU293_03940 [Moraxella nasovis]|uniref:helix-turn-helix domain-containing protein n=1 Tax=Moraxella nasovis TaxID=2904121 RepID=UPI001F6251E6|nr:helix-turn-helix domain-containing protein [Moraxella nasovis]UNU74052.1 hypothetical protein LU293_03940 [Moraxella nasovis]
MAQKGLNANKKQPTAQHIKLIEQMTAKGHSIPNIAKACNISKSLFYVWREKFPEVEQALELGREKERQDLHNMLYTQAMEKGNITAAIFLLKARHGYKEYDQTDQANKVAITFNLPAPAQNMDDYLKVVSQGDK